MPQITVTLDASDVHWIVLALETVKNMVAARLDERNEDPVEDDAYNNYSRLQEHFQSLLQ